MINVVTLHGNVTRDPTTHGKDGSIVKTSIAINEGRGDDRYTSFFDLVFFGKLGEIVKSHVKKGKEIVISGRLRQDRWEADGQKRSSVTIIVNELQFCGSGDKSEKSTENSDSEAPF